MRILTVMSGVILSATGAWCLSYYSSAFSSIAFVLGLAMILSALFLVVAYLISGKKRLPETVLVEGMITLMFGFVILNNEVTDTVLSLFFGAWLAMSGVLRFSQSLAVSRFDPKNWPKVLPMGVLSAIVGFIMLMRSLVSSSNQLTLVGAAFILNGLSQLIYAMYMIKHEKHPKAEQAKERVEAKQALAEVKRLERDGLRQLGRKEREEKKKELRELRKAEALAKKKEAKAQKSKEKSERESLLDPTVQLSEEETREIAKATGAAAIEASLKAVEPEVQAEGSDYANKALEQSKTLESEPLEQSDPEPQISMDENFFGVTKEPEKEKEPEEPIMSWETLNKEPSWKKPDITEILESEVKAPESVPFKSLTLEELIDTDKSEEPKEEELKKEKAREKRFTEEFSWHWPPKGE